MKRIIHYYIFIVMVGVGTFLTGCNDYYPADDSSLIPSVKIPGSGGDEVGVSRSFTVNGVTFKMKLVEAGTFKMGSTTGYSDEVPVHSVTISKDYYIGETEVTQALWKAVTGYSPTSDGYSWSSTVGLGDDYPAYYISYEDVQSFLKKLNSLTGQKFRMPTEAEWEFAARGGNKSKGYTYSGSKTIGDVAWYTDNSSRKTHPVKTKAANELGIYDMSGNVWEWCSDWYGTYSSSAQTDPTGPATGAYRVFRGGGCDNYASSCRCAYRNNNAPSYRSYCLGVRLAFAASSFPVDVTEITLDKTSVTLEPGSTAQLTATVSPDNASDKRVTWTSSNTSVATVDDNGKVTAVAEGTATITVQSVSNNSVKATCQVKVLQETLSFTVAGVTFKMKLVEAGTFQMGSTTGYSNEAPVHSVTISKDYYIGETEVTQALWKAVTGYSPTSGGSAWSSEDGLGDYYPAYYINYEDVQSFLTKLNSMTGGNFRMPTEAEWEFAARGGNKSQGYTYSGSNTVGDVAWYMDNSSSKAHPVKTKAANELGIYDMSGNVWEWCSDWHDTYSSSAQTDPTGPATGTYRVCRGGGWYNFATSCRCAYRNFNSPSSLYNCLGFRLAL